MIFKVVRREEFVVQNLTHSDDSRPKIAWWVSLECLPNDFKDPLAGLPIRLLISERQAADYPLNSLHNLSPVTEY